MHAFKLQKAFKIKNISHENLQVDCDSRKKTCPIVTQPQRNFGNEVKIH